MMVNVARIVWDWLGSTVHTAGEGVTAQPVQPLKAEPDAAVAWMENEPWLEKLAWHVGGQEMPEAGGRLTTVPAPFPSRATVSEMVGGTGKNVAETVLPAAGMVRLQIAPVAESQPLHDEK